MQDVLLPQQPDRLFRAGHARRVCSALGQRDLVASRRRGRVRFPRIRKWHSPSFVHSVLCAALAQIVATPPFVTANSCGPTTTCMQRRARQTLLFCTKSAAATWACEIFFCCVRLTHHVVRNAALLYQHKQLVRFVACVALVVLRVLPPFHLCSAAATHLVYLKMRATPGPHNRLD